VLKEDRYISSPRLVPWLDLKKSSVSLATCCISYLCQKHHDSELAEEAIRQNALEGKYILHELATASWLELVERVIGPGHRDVAIPSELVHSLEMLLEDRSNPEFIGEFENEQPQIVALKVVSPDLHDLLAKAIGFRQEYSVSQHKRQKGEFHSHEKEFDATS
jgi:hypothetical protein